MNAKELEHYILDKQDVRKRVIRDWRCVRYTVYCSHIATIFEYGGEPALTVFGSCSQYRLKYPEIVLPAVDNQPDKFTTVLFTRQIPDSVIKDMIDCAYVLRLKQTVRPRVAVKGAERVAYSGIVSGYYVEDGVIKSRKPCAPDEVFAALDEMEGESERITVERERVNLQGEGDMNSVPYSVNITPQQLNEFLKTRKDLQDELQNAIDAACDD